MTPKRYTFFRCKYLEPLISLKKCSIFKRNILILIFIITKSQISRLHIAGDIQHNRVKACANNADAGEGESGKTC